METCCKIDRAITMALRAHTGQLDKAGRPYILHPLRLAAQHERDETLYIVAILHDVVEDSPIILEEILAEFGPAVAGAIDALTHRKGEDYLTAYIPRVIANPIAPIIKRSDLLDNMRAERLPIIDDRVVARMTRYRQALQLIDA